MAESGCRLVGTRHERGRYSAEPLPSPTLPRRSAPVSTDGDLNSSHHLQIQLSSFSHHHRLSLFLYIRQPRQPPSPTMRLLNTTSLKLEYFAGQRVPKYAILSHKWEDEEIMFQDLQTDEWPQKNGAYKVKQACSRANEDGFGYIWIDTCCIDKSSSAELSEAINSMFNWYQHSQVCYVYLFDVPTKELTESVWFTRGWTLQELIAPEKVQFFDSQWTKIGDRLSLLDPIVKVTAIDRRVLGRGQHHRHCLAQAHNPKHWWICTCRKYRNDLSLSQLLPSFSVATRLSWASTRVTTRVEDGAYALLGLFNVNMPLLYGEGTKAFRRLQEEIIRNSNDQSVLAGQRHLCSDLTISPDDQLTHLFPAHPRAFMNAAHLERPSTSSKYLSMTLTNRCLKIDLHVCPCWWSYRRNSGRKLGWLGILACVYSDDHLSRPAILLDKPSSAENDQHVFTHIAEFYDTLMRIPPGILSNSNEEVEISEAELVVWLNPSRIEMKNINLLIHDPMKIWGSMTPAIRINPDIQGHDRMAYRIRASCPELEEASNGHARGATFMIRKPQEVYRNMPGLLAIDNGSHGFFVEYGVARSVGFRPWCRLLAWHQVVTDEDFIPGPDWLANTLQHMLLYRDTFYHENDQPPHDTMDWPDLGIRAQVATTPKTFLDQTVYDLEISVLRIDGSVETKVQAMAGEVPTRGHDTMDDDGWVEC